MKKLFIYSSIFVAAVLVVGVVLYNSRTAEAAISLVQTKKGDSGGYSNSFNFSMTSDITSGNTLIINVTSGNTDTFDSVTDSCSNTYTAAGSSANSETGERKSTLYYSKITTGGACTITVTYSAGLFPDTAYIAREYSGLDTSDPLDKTSSANDGANFNQTHDAGTTAATTQNDELVILYGGSSGDASPTFAAGTGYGNGTEQKGFDLYTYAFMSDKTVSSTGAQSGNFTSTGFVRGQGGIATFKAAAAPVAATGTPAFIQFD